MFNRIASTAAGFIVILSALTLAVQRDRIFGVWASDSRPLLELKGEGRTVSGTVHFYQGTTRRASAPIESGSFDERTSGLRLTGRVTLPDGGTVPYVIEGTLQEGRLQVSLTLDRSERLSGSCGVSRSHSRGDIANRSRGWSLHHGSMRTVASLPVSRLAHVFSGN